MFFGNVYNRTRDFGLSWANSDTSHRDNISFPCDRFCARETTWFFIPGTGGGGGCCGEDVTVKMGSHGGSSDETALISFSGMSYSGSGGEWASEGPHTNDGGVNGTINDGSVTLSGDQPREFSQHHEIWTSTDDGANWTLDAVFEGTSGTNPLTCPIPPDGEGNCHDTLRLDEVTPEGHELQRRSMVEITPGDGTPVGGGNPPAEIPTQDRDGGGEGGGGNENEEEPPEEEEEEEEEEEDEEETEGSCEGSRCTCANGAFFPFPGCTNDQCTRICSSSANRARLVVRARSVMQSYMYKSLDGKRYRYNRYLPRQNGNGFAFASKRHLHLGNLY